jgi:hypothetical protein
MSKPGPRGGNAALGVNSVLENALPVKVSLPSPFFALLNENVQIAHVNQDLAHTAVADAAPSIHCGKEHTRDETLQDKLSYTLPVQAEVLRRLPQVQDPSGREGLPILCVAGKPSVYAFSACHYVSPVFHKKVLHTTRHSVPAIKARSDFEPHVVPHSKKLNPGPSARDDFEPFAGVASLRHCFITSSVTIK